MSLSGPPSLPPTDVLRLGQSLPQKREVRTFYSVSVLQHRSYMRFHVTRRGRKDSVQSKPCHKEEGRRHTRVLEPILGLSFYRWGR